MQSSSPQISHSIELSRALRARSSSGTRIWWSRCRWTKRISTLPRIRPACQPLRVLQGQFVSKSVWQKPDGLFVIQPEEVDTFLLPLPVERLPGVGKVIGERL